MSATLEFSISLCATKIVILDILYPVVDLSKRVFATAALNQGTFRSIIPSRKGHDAVLECCDWVSELVKIKTAECRGLKLSPQ